MAFDPGVDILIQPDWHPGPVLKVSGDQDYQDLGVQDQNDTPEDQIDRLHHHFLDLLTTTVRHPDTVCGALKQVRTQARQTP